MSKHPIVIQGTSFLQAKESDLLTEKELAIVLEIVCMVDSTDEDDKDYESSVQEWYEILGITGSNRDFQFKNIFQDLMMKIVEIPCEGRGWLLTHWISSVL
ncbi:replication initiation protein [Planococcus sp. MERTA32b]|nr:replication initiation protein [Planococcus sp. MER TA 32b]